MVTATIFKIKEAIKQNGERSYKVIGYDGKLGYFFGWESFFGAKENETFTEALDQIDTLIKERVISFKTVHVVFPNKSKSKSKKEVEYVK